MSRAGPGQFWVRLKFTGGGAPPSRDFVGETLLLQSCWINASDVYSFIALPNKRDFEICFFREAPLRRFLEIQASNSTDPKWRDWTLESSIQIDTTNIVVKFWTGRIADEDIELYLRRYCSIIHQSKPVDKFGIWYGVRRYKVKINKDSNGHYVTIPNSISLGPYNGRIIYPGQIASCFICQSPDHQRTGPAQAHSSSPAPPRTNKRDAMNHDKSHPVPATKADPVRAAAVHLPPETSASAEEDPPDDGARPEQPQPVINERPPPSSAQPGPFKPPPGPTSVLVTPRRRRRTAAARRTSPAALKSRSVISTSQIKAVIILPTQRPPCGLLYRHRTTPPRARLKVRVKVNNVMQAPARPRAPSRAPRSLPPLRPRTPRAPPPPPTPLSPVTHKQVHNSH
ncbi:hypothetical protein WMY93_015735 [Mugilogobius chulae]|uniref:Uncharacterized protein n=1 Tax=Mugilogobius chulae TaxID=88201 RepID=A0AAW0NXD7_9GOBI